MHNFIFVLSYQIFDILIWKLFFKVSSADFPILCHRLLRKVARSRWSWYSSRLWFCLEYHNVFFFFQSPTTRFMLWMFGRQGCVCIEGLYFLLLCILWPILKESAWNGKNSVPCRCFYSGIAVLCSDIRTVLNVFTKITCYVTERAAA